MDWQLGTLMLAAVVLLCLAVGGWLVISGETMLGGACLVASALAFIALVSLAVRRPAR